MILRAKYVMPSSHEIVENGALRIHEDTIVEVGSFPIVAHEGDGTIVDLGDVALLPGFINAHTHLELGGLAGLLPPPNRFTDWLRAVRAHGQRISPENVAEAVREGVRQALAGGTTTLVDVTLTGLSVDALRETPIRKRVHYETLGFDAARTDAAIATLRARLETVPDDDPLLTIGVSPHAPYSTSEQLYRECIRLAREEGWALCSHIAETIEEEEFLREGTGPFVDLLEDFGIALDDWTPPGTTPVQYLHALGFFDSAPLLIHGNYVRDEDIPILRDRGVTVVYCPRSHAYFGHGDHPFEKLFALGVNVALGTDSLASAPNLSMLEEMKFMARRYPHVSPERILTLAMLNGAKSVKVRAKVGGLRSGWKADIVAVSVAHASRRVAESLLDDEAEVVMTMVDGVVCHRTETIETE